MSINKPYYRIFRPNRQNGNRYFADYVIDQRNITDWSSPIRAYDLIIEDFKKICEYIDPREDNYVVYSHRLYEVFIRTCTELESNMKAILKANGYVKKRKAKIINEKWWNIDDYKNLEPILNLSGYVVLINFWNGGRGEKCIPFQNWKINKSGKIVWYQDYNEVKHNREEKFHLASLENLLNSLCGLFVILFSQYGVQAFSPYQNVQSYNSYGEIISKSSSIFSIKPPVLKNNEQYDFDWTEIRGEKNPFREFFVSCQKKL